MNESRKPISLAKAIGVETAKQYVLDFDPDEPAIQFACKPQKVANIAKLQEALEKGQGDGLSEMEVLKNHAVELVKRDNSEVNERSILKHLEYLGAEELSNLMFFLTHGREPNPKEKLAMRETLTGEQQSPSSTTTTRPKKSHR